MDEDNLKFITQLRAALDNNTVPRSEFDRLVKRLFEALAKREEKLNHDFQFIRDAVDNLSREVSEKTDITTGEVRQIARKTAEDVSRTLDAQVRKVDMKLAEVRDGENGLDADEEKIVSEVLALIKLPEQKEVILDGPEQIRAKLEMLSDGLGMSMIAGLKEELSNIKEMFTRIPRGGTGGRTVRFHFVDDLSGSTDGSTKTFTLLKQPIPHPHLSLANSVRLTSSDFPHPYRYTTDFTIAGRTLTLTSAVDAPTSGATLIAEYPI